MSPDARKANAAAAFLFSARKMLPDTSRNDKAQGHVLRRTTRKPAIFLS
jgi:hypothetical protein